MKITIKSNVVDGSEQKNKKEKGWSYTQNGLQIKSYDLKTESTDLYIYINSTMLQRYKIALTLSQ